VSAGLVLGVDVRAAHHDVHTVHLPYSNIKLEYCKYGKHSAHSPIIALPGFLDTYHSYSLLEEHLQEYRIYALSLPCTGGSGHDTNIASDIIQLAHVVKEFIDQLGLDRVVIIGHSMSSILAAQIARLYPGKVKAFILLGPKASFEGDHMSLDYFGLIEETASHLGGDDYFPEQFIKDAINNGIYDLSSVSNSFLEREISDAKKIPAKCWVAGVKAMREASFVSLLSEITRPCLILYGDHDFFGWDAEVGGVEALILNLRKLQFNKLYKIGHAPHWEDPSECAHLIEVFLKSL